MNAAAQGGFTSEAVSLEWRESDVGQPVSATCLFKLKPLRHVFEKHVNSGEPWSRVLSGTLLQRLVQTARSGHLPAAVDCQDFVKSIADQLIASCAKPLLCRFVETEIPVFQGVTQTGPAGGKFARCEKILVVFQSGAVAFLRVTPSPVSDETSMVFLTSFFPRQAAGWVTQKRANAATVARYVQLWAPNEHHTGGRVPPKPADTVAAINEETGAATQVGQFRFISLKAWGFRRQKDGQWVWPEPC